MLCALNENGNVINLLETEAIKGLYTCPACGSEVRLKCGQIKAAHFAHVRLQNCSAWSENESVQHLNLKKALYQWFLKDDCTIELEKYLPNLAQTPDLLVNDQLAIEIQCSPLSVVRLRERTANYHAHGYSVLWLMGHDLWLSKSITALQCELTNFSENCGFYFWELDLKREKLYLKSLLHQSLCGRLVYMTREFSFGNGKLLTILRSPYLAQRLMSLSVSADKNLRQFISRQLYYRQSKWMKIQENFYCQGRNLLTENFDGPQFAPIGLEILTGEVTQIFGQLTQEVSTYYQNFQNYYRKNRQTKLYPPAFYDKINE